MEELPNQEIQFFERAAWSRLADALCAVLTWEPQGCFSSTTQQSFFFCGVSRLEVDHRAEAVKNIT